MRRISTTLFTMILVFATGSLIAQTQNALEFDGLNDHVSIGQPSSLDFTPNTDPISVAVWFRVDPGDNGSFVSKGYGAGPANHQFQIGYSASDIVFVEIGGVRIDGIAQYDDGIWHHACVTSDGSIFRLYVDGVFESSGTPGSYSDNIDWLIGARRDVGNTGTDFLFTGQLDEVRIWDVQLTLAEIRNNMNREIPNPASEPNLIAYYQFNETSGTLLPDLSGNGNDGTLLNMDPSTDWALSTAPIPYYTVNDGCWHFDSSWAPGQNAPVNPWARTVVNNNTTVSVNVEVEDVTISNFGELSIFADIFFTVNGLLTNLGGPSNLNIEASPSGMGSLIHSTAGVEGTVEQYLSEDQWHYVSSPVANEVSGVYTDIYLIEWSEPDSLWSFIVPVNVPLNVTEGYGAWASSGITGSTVVSYEGTLNTGDYNPTLTFNNNPGEGQGWNLIGNPYPSAVEWNANWVTNNVDATCYVWDGTQYLTWNRLTGIGTKGNGVIPVSQGFFVKANNAGPTMTIPGSERLHSLQSFYKSGDPAPLYNLTVEGNGYMDKAIFSFDAASTTGFDSDYDAYKLKGVQEAPQLYFMEGGEMLSVNMLPEQTPDMTLTLGFEAGMEGKFILNFSRSSEVSMEHPVYLEDLRDGKIVNLGAGGIYGFDAHPDDMADRFRIHFRNPVSYFEDSGTADLMDYSVEVTGNSLMVHFNREISGEVTIYNLLGQMIDSRDVEGSKRVEFSNARLQGIGILEIRTSGSTATEKIYLR